MQLEVVKNFSGFLEHGMERQDVVMEAAHNFMAQTAHTLTMLVSVFKTFTLLVMFRKWGRLQILDNGCSRGRFGLEL